ncbi:hypothetical protein ISO51_00165 [Morganella morganii subsp. morganii]|uniref:hypothetical protein n=1 Tax=Morganella morganii TaxID=582 RepID=UPI0016488ED7|nr:hypothetical protein [Morganella morganii]ELA7726246.1 hypothetical protein [Morganella morganii]MBC3999358.1 hypothetical protein [Morganella morganii]MBT0477906.1 hypothetical protein [Morganella morganii subsp. morganii]MBT0482463.1 hypothetical protein [Morganella morganii subsp. morganii]UVZ55542.1 hypothetical protein NYO97_08225 [Morganella morganii]
MIELSPRAKNIIFWISTASISLIIFGIFIIDTFVTDAKGKDKLSIIFSYLSTVFAILSSLGILSTIGVYLAQKKHIHETNNEIKSSVLKILTDAVKLNDNFIEFTNNDTREIKSIIKNTNSDSPVIESSLSFMITTNDEDYLHLYKLTDNGLSKIIHNIYHLDYHLFEQINYLLIIMQIANNKIKTAIYSKRNPDDKVYNIIEALDSYRKRQIQIINGLKERGYLI